VKRFRIQVLLLLGSLLLLVAGGTLGFMAIEHLSPIDALFLTVITLSTVGYGTLIPLNDAGKLFTIGLIVVGVATFSIYLSRLFSMIVERGFLEILEGRRLHHKIDQLAGHYVVCGHGRIGSVVASELGQKKVPLVVLESRAEEVEALAGAGVLALQGDAREESLLRQAGVERAKGLIALMPTDADNLYIILTAKEINPSLTIIARANTLGAERRLMAAGAHHVISPHREGGKRIARMILNPNVMECLEMVTGRRNVELQMEEIAIGERSPLAEKSLLESGLLQKHRILVVAVKHGDGTITFNPEGSTRIHAGDALVTLGPARTEALF